MAAALEGGPLPQRMLRNHLRDEDPIRERAVSKVLAGLSAITTVIALALTPLIGARLSLSLAGVSLIVMAWYLTALLITRRGFWHPAIAWANVAIEVSVLPTVFALDATFNGPEYAISAPTVILWGGLIMLSALRSRRTLAIAAGALGAVEYLAVYFVFVRPQLEADALVTFSPTFMVIRAFFLVATGVFTGLIAHFMLRKAEQALSAVRERDLFGKYFLHERIGAGGMAEVFRATYSPEGGFEKIVAVKRILPAYSDNTDFAHLFRREAQLCSLLNHPNVVQVFDVGRHSGTMFLAMEFIEGLSLRTLLKRRRAPLPLHAVTYLGAEVAGALDYMHRRNGPDGAPLGLVHRDLNPPNLLLSKMGEVKVADFGIARAAGAELQTQAGVVRGKAGYLSPEQVSDEPIDGRTDLFALGVTLHEALTGAHLFEGKDERALMKAALVQPLHPPSTSRPEVPPELDAIVMALLERELKNRLPDAQELRNRLVALGGELAPYPHGQRALATAVQEALAVVPPSNDVKTGPVKPPSRPSSEAATMPSMGGPRSG